MAPVSTRIAYILPGAVVACMFEQMFAKTDAGDGLVRLAADLLKRGIAAHSVEPPAEATLVLFVGTSLRVLAMGACCALLRRELETRSSRRRAMNIMYASLAVHVYVCPQAILAHVPGWAVTAASAAMSAATSSVSALAMATVSFLRAHGVPLPAPELQLLVESILGDERLQRALFAGGVALVLGVSVIERRDGALRALRLLVARWVLVTFDTAAAQGAVCNALPTPPFVCDAINALNTSYPVQMPYVWTAGALQLADEVVRTAFAV